MAAFTDDISINTLIGTNSAIAGDVRVSGFVRIDGDIDGSLETSGKVIIGEKARIRGNVTARAAIVCGIIEGDVYAPEEVQLFSSAAVMGDVITKNIQVADGVLFDGYCIALKDETEFAKAVQFWNDEKAVLHRLRENA
ncbi:MAG: polymer-forming cytoskeletal protein [Treponema sp.]|jgi:cytoskeletal protein CcmA (bactofilin family)|nr:polymer-forming cytoskeletal protein [Treponema sp.]